MVTISDIARESGVSIATVSRYLSKGPREIVTTEKGKEIYEIALRLGYRNMEAMPSSGRFMIVHKDKHFSERVDNAYYFSLRNGIEEEARSNEDSLQFVPLSLLDKEIDGIDGAVIIGNYRQSDQDRILSLLKTDNVVFLGKLGFPSNVHDTVTYDVETCVMLCMDALRKKGNRSVLFVDGKDTVDIQLVYQKITSVIGYTRQYPEIEFKGNIECDGFGSGAGYNAMKEYLANGGAIPDAVFTATDPLAIGVRKALSEKGMYHGKDYSLVSMNGDDSVKWLEPSVVSVCFDSKEMGSEAIRLLHERMANPLRKHRCVYFAPYMTEGGSIVDRR